MEKLVTIVMRRDGRHHLTLECSIADADRWADEGYEVFRLVVRKGHWAFNHVNSGKIFHSTDEAASHPHPEPVDLLMIEEKP